MKVLYLLLSLFLFANQIYSDNNIVYQIGIFDKKPANADSELIKEEFSKLENTEKTIQVKKKEDFPQKLNGNQRIAVFIDEIKPNSDLFLEIKTVISKNADYESIPSIELRYNGNSFYKGKQSWNAKHLKLYIPHSWNEEAMNVLEIRNLGSTPIAFDALAIKRYSLFIEKEEKLNAELPSNIASSAANTASYNSILRDKATCFLPLKIIKYLSEKGKFFSIQEFSGLKDFYDPYTGKPILAYHAISSVAPLFIDQPEIMLSDLIPTAQNDVLYGTCWIAVKNSDNMVTVAVAATPDDKGKSAEIIMPVPWTGKTQVEEIWGILPDNINHNSRWMGRRYNVIKETEIYSKVFRKKFSLNELRIFRLLKSGEKFPRPLKLNEKASNWTTPRFNRSAIEVTKTHPSFKTLITSLVDLKKASSPFNNLTEKYKVSMIPVTKGDISKIEKVAPWDSKSIEVEISYPEEKGYDEEWTEINFSKLPDKCDQLSFWVYPKSGNPRIRRISLLMYFKDKKERKYNFLAASLKIGEWQRITLAEDNIKSINGFRVVGNPRLPEYKNKNKVSFEFNGFIGIDTKSESGLLADRVISGKESNPDNPKAAMQKTKTFILIGKPDSYFEYRYAFEEPIEYKALSSLAKTKDLKLSLRKDAQIFEVKGDFPNKELEIPDKFKKMLTARELKAIEEKGLVPIGIKLTYE
jgi:hypothetical protein